MNGVIYIIKNKINNNVYIGQTIQPIKERWKCHCRKASENSNEKNMAIKLAILKYGVENFSIDILEECNVEDLNKREIFYINKYDSYRNGYNSTLGGSCVPLKHSRVDKSVHKDICNLYNDGFSLRSISCEYQIDKATVKNILSLYNINVRSKRIYKYTRELLAEIKSLLDAGVSRVDIRLKYGISKSYLSQISSGSRRI